MTKTLYCFKITKFKVIKLTCRFFCSIIPLVRIKRMSFYRKEDGIMKKFYKIVSLLLAAACASIYDRMWRFWQYSHYSSSFQSRNRGSFF